MEICLTKHDNIYEGGVDLIVLSMAIITIIILALITHALIIHLEFKSLEKSTPIYLDENLDEELDEQIKLREQRLKQFDEIVGSNPLEQIDWIIENGFNKYIEIYNDIMSGEYQKKKEQEERKSLLDIRTKRLKLFLDDGYSTKTINNYERDFETEYAMGGIGNRKLLSFINPKVYTTNVECNCGYDNEI